MTINAENFHMNENYLQATTDLRTQPSGRKEHGKGCPGDALLPERECQGIGLAISNTYLRSKTVGKLAGWSVRRFKKKKNLCRKGVLGAKMQTLRF